MNLFLAPLQGMTIAYYRNSFARHFGNIDEYYAPFITTSKEEKIGNMLFKDLFPEKNDSSVKLIPQLLGNDGEQFKLYARAIMNLGYKEINWNIGCPYPMVANRKRGAGILKYPDLIKTFLDNACSDSSYEVTVKMRLGWDDLQDGVRVIEMLNEYPLKSVIVHARTGIQMYSGHVDLEAFELLMSLSKHDITYNGDIFTVDDYERISKRFPNIKNFMLGRGALSDPFLPAAIKGNSFSKKDKIITIHKFHDDIYNYYKSVLSGEQHLCDKMKEFWSYLYVSVGKDEKFMKKIKKCNRASDYLELLPF